MHEHCTVLWLRQTGAELGFEHRGACKPATTMHVKMYTRDKDVHNTQINVYVAIQKKAEKTKK